MTSFSRLQEGCSSPLPRSGAINRQFIGPYTNKLFSSALITSCPVTCPRASLVQVSCKPITFAMLGGLRVRVGTNYVRAMPPRHKVPYARAASSSIFGTIQHLLSSEGALAFKDLHVKKVLHTPTLSSLPRSVAVFHELRTNRDLESFDAADFMDGARASVPLPLTTTPPMPWIW